MAIIKLSRDNLYYNLNQLVLKAGSKDHLAVVLKDNAYGHGLKEIAQLAYEYGIKEAVVVSNREADSICNLFENILILNDTPSATYNYSYAISSLKQLQELDSDIKIELKVDTGMHRNGIMPSELSEALRVIKRRKLNLFGVMTHFRSADELTGEYFWQKRSFEDIKEFVKKEGFLYTRFHSHNSAGLLRSESFDEDIARVGIAIYGYNPLPKVFGDINLRPVLSLWARRNSTRNISKGEHIGYGGDFIASRGMLVSTYDLGYGDGFPRGDSSNPYHTAEGLEILGRVSMDFISLETDKEEVCVMEDAKRASEHFKTIPYEMTTALMPHILRIVV